MGTDIDTLRALLPAGLEATEFFVEHVIKVFAENEDRNAADTQARVVIGGAAGAIDELAAIAVGAIQSGHDVWTTDNHHNWATCDHPTCRMVRDYEAMVDQWKQKWEWVESARCDALNRRIEDLESDRAAALAAKEEAEGERDIAMQYLEMVDGCPVEMDIPTECDEREDGEAPSEDCTKCWLHFIHELGTKREEPRP